MKKLLSFVLTCAMLLTMASFGVFADENVIEITTAEELAKIGNDENYPLSGTYKLTADLTIDTTAHLVSFGNQNNVFTGTFDGDNHTITYALELTADQRTGLFCSAGGDGCTIKNLTVKGSVVGNGEAKNSLGGVVGTAKGQITFENIVCEATLTTVGDEEGRSGTGGILGVNEGQTVTFKNCTSSATVSGKRGVGGFLGMVRNGGSVEIFENCTFDGKATNVYEWSDKRGVGGFIGIMHKDTGDEVNVTFKNCASNGTVEAYSTLASAWVASYARFGHADQLPVFDNCTQTAKVIISGYELSKVSETKYPEAHDTQCSGNFSYNAEAKTVTGWTNFAMNAETATAMASAAGTKVYVNGVLDETATITADGRKLTVVCSDPTVTAGTRTSILVVWADGHFTTLGQNHTIAEGDAALVTFTAEGANAESTDYTKNLNAPIPDPEQPDTNEQPDPTPTPTPDPDPDPVKPAPTGDAITVLIAVSAVAMAAIAIVVSKKRSAAC
ncbi:MAG: hypothetical protein IJX47_01430 [Clostridia bacterium]|nr:hypothetical protein [Clostridia bacterium]